ncbi:hypothetical protein EV356DRAFT_534482 [Viridothelium virens]|uniref:Uncharacterized protein n=1 Tax=Viridothelium virens TaxID=1048519 RepID=A0A6A6H4W2_VIRVR|nr:hypothetical protein EV356DRAFT_534482 [Viridothelium virens]
MSRDPVFFTSPTPNACSFNGTTIHADLNTQNGNLCAYISGIPRVWACPALNNVCWSWNYACHGGDDTTPDSTQQVCNNNGQTWCCSKEYELCTQTEGQASVCWATFANPNKDLNASEAVDFDSTAYPTLTSTTINPISTALSPSSSSTLATPGVDSTAPNPSTTSSTHSTNSISLSQGSLAGIVISSILAGVFLAGLITLFIRKKLVKRLRQEQTVASSSTHASFPPQELSPETLVEANGQAGVKRELSTEQEQFELLGSSP